MKTLFVAWHSTSPEYEI